MFRDVIIMLSAISVLIITVILAVCIMLILDGCTLSFTNIDTHGTSTDLVDEEQTASPDIKTNLTIPVKL